jgi:enterochelin esterase-like enzyme
MTRTPTITPTPVCTSGLGQLLQVELTTELMYQPFKMTVYLPPCYDLYTDRNYPVLYLFHGIYYSSDQWERLGATHIADRLISTGEIPPFIIVMPYDPNAREPASTFFDEIFLEQAVPYVDKNYRTIPDAKHRAVGGLSRGAGWAIHFGLTHPELFGAIGAHSPVIFWEDGPQIGKWLDAIPRIEMPHIYMDIGDRDPNHDSTELFKKLLQDRNIPFEWYLNSGFHTEEYWSLHVEDYLRWYAGGW